MTPDAAGRAEPIARYDMEDVGHNYVSHYKMVQDDEYGDWVRYEDYESEVTRLRAEVEALREEWKQSLPVLERLYRAVLALPTPLGREVAEAVDEYHAAIGRIAALPAARKGEG